MKARVVCTLGLCLRSARWGPCFHSSFDVWGNTCKVRGQPVLSPQKGPPKLQHLEKGNKAELSCPKERFNTSVTCRSKPRGSTETMQAQLPHPHPLGPRATVGFASGASIFCKQWRREIKSESNSSSFNVLLRKGRAGFQSGRSLPISSKGRAITLGLMAYREGRWVQPRSGYTQQGGQRAQANHV